MSLNLFASCINSALSDTLKKQLDDPSCSIKYGVTYLRLVFLIIMSVFLALAVGRAAGSDCWEKMAHSYEHSSNSIFKSGATFF